MYILIYIYKILIYLWENDCKSQNKYNIKYNKYKNIKI